MADLEWQASDSRDLIRRDRRRAWVQGIPFLGLSGLFALWLKRSEPVLAAVFLGVFIAWLLSVALQIYWAPSRWRVLQTGPTRVSFDDLGITWLASHGSRLLRWDRLSVSRCGDTWIISVRGHEAAFIPARCLDANEAGRLEGRLGKAQNERAVEQ